MIIDTFEKHSLLNKLAGRRRFYNDTMNDRENVLGFSSRIWQLYGTLKSIGVIIEDSEMPIEVLNGQPDQLDGLFSALYALGNDKRLFKL